MAPCQTDTPCADLFTPACACPSSPCSSYLENQMAVALGGRVAEELIYGPDNVTTGASGDFQQVRPRALTQ